MVSNVKTTIEIADGLLDDARRVARAEGVTLRALVERGLRREVADAECPPAPHKMVDRSVDGTGLSEEFRNAKWGQLRDEIYQEHLRDWR